MLARDGPRRLAVAGQINGRKCLAHGYSLQKNTTHRYIDPGAAEHRAESSGLLGTVSGRAVALAQRGRIGTCSCSSLLVAGRINPTEVPRMTPDATRLLAEALHLPESERSELAARLIESLDPSGQEDATAAW